MKWKHSGTCLFLLSLLTGCTYNPFLIDNHTTGSPAAAVAGASIGAGGVALLGGTKLTMAIAGIAGGATGYYVTTLRYAAGGVLQGGGKVYKIGDYLGIYIPTDNLFEPNTADFLPQAEPILDSAAATLRRYPNRSVLISGNTSGFYRAYWEQGLSERRAQKVAGYLWSKGINQANPSGRFHQLTYVGHGDYFPIANKFTNKGLRENSRIQITSYPVECDLLAGRGIVAYRMTNPAVVARVNSAVVAPPPLVAPTQPIAPCQTLDSQGRCMENM